MTSDPRPQDEQAVQPADIDASGSESDDVKLDMSRDVQAADRSEVAGAKKRLPAEVPQESSSEVAPRQDEGAAEPDAPAEPDAEMQWYIVKVQVNREESIRRALERRIQVADLGVYFREIVVPTEDVAEYNKSGKRRVVKKKLYPGYIMIHMALNEETWFLVRETPGIGDFTGSAGKPTPMEAHEVQRIVMSTRGAEVGEAPVRTSIPFKSGDRVRVKEGYFENFEGSVEAIDEANGRVTVMINIFGRSTPVELEHWQVEAV